MFATLGPFYYNVTSPKVSFIYVTSST